MEEQIEKTLRIAKENFAAFGFSEEQVSGLLASGERDLRKEMLKLQLLLEDPSVELSRINDSLHALKGLFLNMGDNETATYLIDLRAEESEVKIELLKRRFFA